MTSTNLARHLRRNQRQTRLTFDSAAEPTSSRGLTPARVRYEGSSSRAKKTFDLSSRSQVQSDDEDDLFPSGQKFAVVIESPPKLPKRDGSGKLQFQHFSTPLASAEAQTQVSDDGDHDIDDLPSHTSKRRRILAGNPSEFGVELPEPLGNYKDLSLVPAGSPSFVDKAKKHKTKRAFAYDGTHSSDGSPPEKYVRPTRTKTIKQSTPVLVSDSSDDSLLQSPPRVGAKGGKVIIAPVKNTATIDEDKQKTLTARSFLQGGSYSAPVIGKEPSVTKSISISVTPSQVSKRGKKTTIVLSDNDSSDEEEVLPTPRRTQSSSIRKRQVETTKRPFRADTMDDDTDDEFPDIGNINTPSKENRQSNVLAVNIPSDDEEEEPISSPLKRRRPDVITDGSNDEDSDAPSPTKRSKVGRRREVHSDNEKIDQRGRKDKGTARARKHQLRRLTRQEQQRQKKPHRSAQQKAMELAKRRRAGEKISKVTDSESSEDMVQRGIYDSDSDMQVLSEFDDESEDGIEAIRQSLKAKNRNEYDEFVVEDDDEPIGVPTIGLHDIPLQFTHAAHKHLKAHFKDAVEWLVQKKINPLFNKDDPLYNQAFKKLDDEVHGYASSKFSSSAWTKGFHHALWARPSYWDGPIGAAERESLGADKCEACNRSHPTTYTIQFTGRAYYKLTLEEVDKDHSSSDEDENDDEAEDDSTSSDGSSVNSKGQPIPKESKFWHVGRFCRANAEIAHSLIHWKFALNSWVVDRLAEEHHLEPAKLAQREGWTTKKKGKYANRIVDKWEARGILGGLYGEFKTNLQNARDHKQNRY